MRFILCLFILFSGNHSFAQKRQKNKEPFSYHYVITGERYKINYPVYIRVSQGNGDTLIVSGNTDTPGLTGMVYLNHYSSKEQAALFDGSFELRFDVKDLIKNRAILAFEEFGSCLESHTVIDPDKIPDTFTMYLQKRSIFDPETGYVTIYSKTALSQDELDEIIWCMSSRSNEQPCYDQTKIRVSIAI